MGVVVKVVAKRLEGGTTHAHVAAVRWRNEKSGTDGESRLQDLVNWLWEAPCRNRAYVIDREHGPISLLTRHSPRRRSYVQAFDGTAWVDSLLALPNF